MARHCTNCGAEIPEGADFCPDCGRTVPQEQEAPRGPDQQREPQPVSSQAAATEQQWTPSSPTTPQQPAFQPAPAAVGPTSNRGCLLGGLAVAALLGFLAFVVAVGLVLYSFLVGARSEELLSERPTPQQASGQGSLQDLVSQQAGDFTLDGELQEYTGALQDGATQAVFMDYRDSARRGIVHHLAMFPTSEAANQYLRKEVELFTDPEAPEPWEKVEEVDLTDEQGQRIGTAVLLHGEVLGKPADMVLWTNGNLNARAVAFPERYVVEFFNAPPPY